MKYRINLHAHTIFSDGKNSPYAMALKAKELDFTALIITDHFYGDKFQDVSITKEKWRTFEKACSEAKGIIPVIKGLEVPVLGHEVLFFGGKAIKYILENGQPDKQAIINMRRSNECVMILCHPTSEFDEIAPLIDGFEHYNSGCNFFKKRAFGPLAGLPRWCNSDAHQASCLEKAFNIVGSKIENESDLMKYIRRGNQPEFCVNLLSPPLDMDKVNFSELKPADNVK